MSDIPLLRVEVNGTEVSAIDGSTLPAEQTPSVPVTGEAEIAFIDSAGRRHTHRTPPMAGWLHLSIRVHANFGCQADCAITDAEHYDPQDLGNQAGAYGIRFQPFFLPGTTVDEAEFRGRGLFARGLVFAGSVNPGNVLLSAECDACRRSFLVRTFHAGFSASGYMYSGSGAHTLLIPDRVAGAPAPLADPEPAALAALEARLPLAPDGTAFRYRNPFRCPHCQEPYIDFAAHPEQRPGEYYGCYFPDVALIHFDESAVATPEPPARQGPFGKLFRRIR